LDAEEDQAEPEPDMNKRLTLHLRGPTSRITIKVLAVLSLNLLNLIR